MRRKTPVMALNIPKWVQSAGGNHFSHIFYVSLDPWPQQRPRRISMGVWANILSIPTGLFARNHADLVLRANIRRDQRRLFARIPFKQLILRSWTTIWSLLGKQEPRFCYNGCPSDPLDADMGNHYYGRAAMFARTPVCTHPSLPQRPHHPTV